MTRNGNPYVILTEEAVPQGIQHCERCELSKQRTRVIWGEGNPEAQLPYNKPAAREACFPHLQSQLLKKRPLVLFGFGNVVAETLFPLKENASVKELRGNWHEYQGIPIGFTYHPLAVRRRPNLMNFFVDDLIALKDKFETTVTNSAVNPT